MKKYLILILLVCVGCFKQDKVNTIIEENDTFLIGINYPNTEYKFLNQIIKNDIDDIKNEFIKTYTNTSMIEKSELNIDYKVTNFEGYLNIMLDINISSLETNHYVKTYFYDINKNHLYNLNEILSNNDILKIKNDLSKENINIHYLDNYLSNPYFFIYEDNIDIYFLIDNKLITLNYPNYLFKYKIDLKTKNSLEKVDTFYVKNKVYDVDKKYVALTFDDGPSIYTKIILETLKKNEVNATFFVLGNKVEMYADVLKESLENGNVIGNHSYNHKWLVKLKGNELKEQINKTNEKIKEYTGYTPTLFRPTYGSVNSNMKKLDIDIVLWTVDTMDWKYKNVNKIVSRATKNLKDGDIILMHDIYKTSALSLDKIITEIKKQGFEIVTVLELKEIEKIRNYE